MWCREIPPKFCCLIFLRNPVSKPLLSAPTRGVRAPSPSPPPHAANFFFFFSVRPSVRPSVRDDKTKTKIHSYHSTSWGDLVRWREIALRNGPNVCASLRVR